jgi:hypothetical protein
MTIDVYFTGLMLICFTGQPDCPVTMTDWNTAWVLKIDGQRQICGPSNYVTQELEVRFSKLEFDYTELPKKTYCDDKEVIVKCRFPDEEIVIKPNMGELAQNLFVDGLRHLPRLEEVDRRFRAVRKEILEDSYYVPARIHFPKGVLSTGAKWSTGRPRLWYRSDRDPGGALPRELSDRLKVTYAEATTLTLTAKTYGLLLERTAPNAQISFQRPMNALPIDSVGEFQNLIYLQWYYHLGSWATRSGYCPKYDLADKNSAVVLSCLLERESTCACYDGCDRDTTFWPPMVRPGF